MAQKMAPNKMKLLDDESWHQSNEGTVVASASATAPTSDVTMAGSLIDPVKEPKELQPEVDMHDMTKRVVLEERMQAQKQNIEQAQAMSQMYENVHDEASDLCAEAGPIQGAQERFDVDPSSSRNSSSSPSSSTKPRKRRPPTRRRTNPPVSPPPRRPVAAQGAHRPQAMQNRPMKKRRGEKTKQMHSYVVDFLKVFDYKHFDPDKLADAFPQIEKLHSAPRIFRSSAECRSMPS